MDPMNAIEKDTATPSQPVEKVTATPSQPVEKVTATPSQPVVMLAPTTRRPSSNRKRTLLAEKEKASKQPTPEETAQVPSNDKDDLEEGIESDGVADGCIDRTREKKKILCIGLGILLAITILTGIIGYFLSRNNRLDTNASLQKTPDIQQRPSQPPSSSPSNSPSASPIISPTLSPMPSASAAPSPTPTSSPTRRPTSPPTSTPTASPKPSASPSRAPSRNFIGLLENFLSSFHSVDVSSVYSAMAIEWLAAEATTASFEADGKLVQRFALVSADLAQQGATSFEQSKNAQRGVNECNWTGIACDSDGWVEEVVWYHQPEGQSGSGTISSDLRLLVGSLKVLDLSNNGLMGKIPEELYELTNLVRLFLFKNELEGTISTSIGNLNAITHFHLSHNNLMGQIPVELKSGAGIRPLEYFNVYSNQLIGPLPEDLRLRSCIYFDVGRNQLTGTLPDSLGQKFIALRHAHFDHNNFVGTLPLSYNTVGNGRLESFSIDHNSLTGEIQGERDMFNKLVQWTFHSNQFESMDKKNCKMEVPQGEMVEMKPDCNICLCSGYYNICELQCSSD